MVMISFILPVYNVEKYLLEAFYSIFDQIDDRCEIILVDDGSTDSSANIIDDLNKYNNVRIIHKKNGGLSSARNAGLKIANGKYVAFVDSDDRIANNSVKELLKLIQNSKTDIDLIFMQAIKFYNDGTVLPLGDDITTAGIADKTKPEIIEYISLRPKYPGSSCTKVYLKKFLDNNNLYFPNDKRQAEDLGFVRDCIMMAENYSALDCPYYEYRQGRNGSITSIASPKALIGLLLFIEDTVKKYPITKSEFNKMALRFAAYEYGVLLLNYALLNENEKDSFQNKVNKYAWTLKYSKGVKYKILFFMINLFGVKFTSACVKYLYSRR